MAVKTLKGLTGKICQRVEYDTLKEFFVRKLFKFIFYIPACLSHLLNFTHKQNFPFQLFVKWSFFWAIRSSAANPFVAV